MTRHELEPMTTESIVCMDPNNCEREHVGGMGGTPVHLPADGVVVPGRFDHGVPSDGDEIRASRPLFASWRARLVFVALVPLAWLAGVLTCLTLGWPA